MRILGVQFDRSFDKAIEDLSVNSQRYGGGATLFRFLKQKYAGLRIIGIDKCFENYQDNDLANYSVLNDQQVTDILNGKPIVDVYPLAADYDLIVSANPTQIVNTTGIKAKYCAWAVGYAEKIHPQLKYLMLYNEFQQPMLQSRNTKMYKVQIGKPCPPFRNRSKEDYIFQCSRHEDIFCSIELAKYCKQNGIKLVLAGKIQENYPLMDYVDGKTVDYVGQISEVDKLDYFEGARLSTSISNGWPTPFSLSAIESLSCGTPVCATKVGFWSSLIRNGVNGFFLENYSNLAEVFEKAKDINPINCWLTARNFTEEKMIDSFMNVFVEILNDKD